MEGAWRGVWGESLAGPLDKEENVFIDFHYIFNDFIDLPMFYLIFNDFHYVFTLLMF